MIRGTYKRLFVIGLIFLAMLMNRKDRASAQAKPCYQLLFSGMTETRDGDTATHIYSINPDGSGQRQLTDGEVYDSYPLWSADGKHIAFMRTQLYVPEDQNAHLFLMNFDGADVRRLTNKLMVEYFPVWSPDSKTLAFIGKQSDKLAVYTIKPDGTALTMIFSLKATADTSFSLSLPDIYGQHPLSFSGDSRYLHIEWPQNGGLVTIDLKNRTPTVLAFDGYDAEWSPDDRRIVYIDGKEGSVDIFVMNADGSGVRQLTSTDQDQYPTWSPDGHIIAFTSNRNGHSDFLSYDVYLMGADGSHLTRLTTDEGDYWNPIWSPDGKQLIFWSNLTQATYIIDSDKQRFHSLIRPGIEPAGTVSTGITQAHRFSWSPLLCRS